MAGEDNNGWEQWKRYVLEELKRQAHAQEAGTEVQRAILVEIATLKVKSTVWGLVGGSIPVLIGLLIALVVWLMKAN